MKRFVKLYAVVVLLTAFIGCGGEPDEPASEVTADALPSGNAAGSDDVAPPEVTFEIREYPERDRDHVVLVRLDIDRLRVYDLSKEEVMKAVEPSGMVDPREPPPRPGVVYAPLPFRPDQYEEIVLKTSPEGEIVRLKDVAKVELIKGREAQEDEPNAAADGGDK